MTSHIVPPSFMEVLHKVLGPELKQLQSTCTERLGAGETRTILKEAWDLAVSEARGTRLFAISSKLELFPALQETAQTLGQLIFATWQENEDDVKEAEVRLLQLGRSKLVVQARKHIKRARAALLLQRLSAALRRHDRETAAWLSQSLQVLGYACDVVSVWHSGCNNQRASA